MSAVRFCVSAPKNDNIFKGLANIRLAFFLFHWSASEHGLNFGRVLGFSAGGTLAANLLVDNGANKGKRKAEGSPSILPDFGCLVYPVITDSLIDQAASRTPPVFILNCRDDRAAPVKYAEKFYNALIINRVKSEAHFFKAGGHGFGLGVNGGDVARWPALFVNWMKELNMIDQR